MPGKGNDRMFVTALGRLFNNDTPPPPQKKVKDLLLCTRKGKMRWGEVGEGSYTKES